MSLPQSQIRQEWPGHGAPGLQDRRGAEGQPVIHSHPGGLLQAGEVCMDQWHQPGMSTWITVSGSQTRSRGWRQKACKFQNSLTCPLCSPLCCICPTVHRQHPLQWANDERVWGQLQSHSATDDQVSLIFNVDIRATLRMLLALRSFVFLFSWAGQIPVCTATTSTSASVRWWTPARCCRSAMPASSACWRDWPTSGSSPSTSSTPSCTPTACSPLPMLC